MLNCVHAVCFVWIPMIEELGSIWGVMSEIQKMNVGKTWWRSTEKNLEIYVFFWGKGLMTLGDAYRGQINKKRCCINRPLAFWLQIQRPEAFLRLTRWRSVEERRVWVSKPLDCHLKQNLFISPNSTRLISQNTGKGKLSHGIQR